MIESIAMPAVHIRYKGVMDFQNMWKVVHDWFESKGYEIIEPKAKHKTAPFGVEFESTIEAWRNVTEIYRFKMIAYQKHWDGTYVEVVKDGKKKKLLKARFFIKVTGWLDVDYSDRYDKSKFTRALGKFLRKRVYRHQIDSIYGDQLFYKIHELMNVIKEYINMETHGSEFADMW